MCSIRCFFFYFHFAAQTRTFREDATSRSVVMEPASFALRMRLNLRRVFTVRLGPPILALTVSLLAVLWLLCYFQSVHQQNFLARNSHFLAVHQNQLSVRSLLTSSLSPRNVEKLVLYSVASNLFFKPEPFAVVEPNSSLVAACGQWVLREFAPMYLLLQFDANTVAHAANTWILSNWEMRPSNVSSGSTDTVQYSPIDVRAIREAIMLMDPTLFDGGDAPSGTSIAPQQIPPITKPIVDVVIPMAKSDSTCGLWRIQQWEDNTLTRAWPCRSDESDCAPPVPIIPSPAYNPITTPTTRLYTEYLTIIVLVYYLFRLARVFGQLVLANPSSTSNLLSSTDFRTGFTDREDENRALVSKLFPMLSPSALVSSANDTGSVDWDHNVVRPVACKAPGCDVTKRIPLDHHCRDCDSHVQLFDHHCYALGKCVSFWMMRKFLRLLEAGCTLCMASALHLFLMESLRTYMLVSRIVLFNDAWDYTDARTVGRAVCGTDVWLAPWPSIGSNSPWFANSSIWQCMRGDPRNEWTFGRSVLVHLLLGVRFATSSAILIGVLVVVGIILKVFHFRSKASFVNGWTAKARGRHPQLYAWSAQRVRGDRDKLASAHASTQILGPFRRFVGLDAETQ